MPDLLLELRSEEIPARMQAKARAALKERVTGGLIEAGLMFVAAEAFVTPRRLALAVEGLSAESPSRREERRGPRVDAPDKAVEGFARSAGLPRERLETREEAKGAVHFAVIDHPGRPAAEIVAEVVERVVREFPWPKSMRWGRGTLRWVRPLHGIVCLLAEEEAEEAVAVDLEIDGIAAGRVTRGHPFMAPGEIAVNGVADYMEKMARGHVMLDAEARAAHIRDAAETAAFAQGLALVEDAGLVGELAGMVEWPVALHGEIDTAFLELPPEVLQVSMKTHQKFLSLRDRTSGQIRRFVTVADRETADAGETILAGNRRVLAARLADAKFFWDNDLRVVHESGLEGMGAGLGSVTFHRRLGSQADRVDRIAALARALAPAAGADPEGAATAAGICKADLESEMVGEFPELQGVMGRYYAEAAGHPEPVAAACEMHYKPLGPDDVVPAEPVSVAVALADKIDMLAGFWMIDERPTGSKDPYALRRAALGVVRTLLETGVRCSMREVVSWATIAQMDSALRKLASVEELTEPFDPRKGEEDRRLRHIQPYQAMLDWDGFVTRNAWEITDALSGGFFSDEEDPEDHETKERVRAAFEAFEARLETLKNFWGASFSLGSEKELPILELHAREEIAPAWREPAEKLASELLPFLHERLKVHLRERGVRHDVIDACSVMAGDDDLVLLVKRAEALQAVVATEEGENLIQGFKRANNILTQAEDADGVEYAFGADPTHAQVDEETALFAALDAAEARIKPALRAEDFATAMGAMAELRAPIDAFFEAVQVNTESGVVRRNRLNLLSRIRDLCRSVADLTRLEG